MEDSPQLASVAPLTKIGGKPLRHGGGELSRTNLRKQQAVLEWLEREEEE